MDTKFIIRTRNLFVLWRNSPVNKFLVMSGWSHRFRGIYQYYGELMCLTQSGTQVGLETRTTRVGVRGSTNRPSAELISAFVFALWTEQSLSFFNLKYKSFSPFLLLCYWSDCYCVRTGREPCRPILSCPGICEQGHEKTKFSSLRKQRHRSASQ